MRAKFQFHKGSINTVNANPLLADCIVFQFHKGSINTGYTPDIRSDEQSFNSIKVRLIHFDAFFVPYRILFQFHKGSINTLVFLLMLRLY